LINNEDFIKWGKDRFKEALKVSEIQQKHLTLLHQIKENIESEFNLKSDIFNDITDICFASFSHTGTRRGPEELRYYWLNYIIKQSPWFDRNLSLEDIAKDILDSVFQRQIINEFKQFAHFEKLNNFKFILNKGQWENMNLNIRVPYCLNYVQIEFAIRVIEKLTNHRVSKISLWYFTYDLSLGEMYSEIYMALDDRIDKHKGHPFITIGRFHTIKIKSYENWYKEFPEFKNYIDEIDNNTFNCKSCGKSIFDSGNKNWRCSFCNHLVDRNGNCISVECETCENDNSDEKNIEAEDLNDIPECKTCEDSNDVSDPGGNHWWCSYCEHTIDRDGDCVSDECETCEKDPFISENGPFYLFFDTETTGVPKDWKAPITNFDNWPRIVQLAWLVYDRNGNQILKKEFIIKPNGFIIPIEASNVHGITTQFAIENGVPIEDVLLNFEKHCEKSKYLIAHNISFDSKVTSSEYLRILSRNPISKLDKICTMESSTNYCKIPGNYGYKWPKLSELHIKLFGVDFEGAHDALADIEATAKCFWEMKKLKVI
jgi:DNA polymerase-3 subunit epsilon